MNKQDHEPIDINHEKEEVIKIVKEYHDAAQKESWNDVEETLAKKVVFFGSDSAENIQSRNDFKKALHTQWSQVTMKYGDIVDQVIYMDNRAKMATIFYGIPMSISVEGDSLRFHVFTRNSKLLKREKDGWKIESGMMSIAADGEEYMRFINRQNLLKAEAEKAKADAAEENK